MEQAKHSPRFLTEALEVASCLGDGIAVQPHHHTPCWLSAHRDVKEDLHTGTHRHTHVLKWTGLGLKSKSRGLIVSETSRLHNAGVLSAT